MDIYFVNIIALFFSVIFGYLIGGIPTGVLVGEIFFHKDPRDYGSKNIGGTNSARVFGKTIGIIVTTIDMLKTIFVIYTIWSLFTFTKLSKYNVALGSINSGSLIYWLAGFFTVIGHCYSPYIKFQGGKAVACFIALCISISWLLTVVTILVFFISIKVFRIVSISSLITGLVNTFSCWLILLLSSSNLSSLSNLTWLPKCEFFISFDIVFCLVITCSFLIMALRHRSNIKRIIINEENTINY